jgi:NAD(P)H-quinone oxidoreductase subunit 5
MVIVSGVIGAFVFNVLTGKGFVANSSIFLTLIVAITVGQVTYNFTKEKSFSVLQKLILPPVLYLTGIFVYAMVYNFVTIVMSDMALVATPTSLSFIHIAFGVVFLIGFIVMKLGLYQKFPWIYVQFLNMTQPSRKTV